MRPALFGIAALGVASSILSVTCNAEASENAAQHEVNRNNINEISKDGLFVETFEQEEIFDGSRWIKSTHEKYSSQEISLDEYTVSSGRVTPEKGLVLDAPAKHYGLAVKLDEPLQVTGEENKKEMVIQYEVKLKNGLSCGGAYLKLLRADVSSDLSNFDNETPYVLMFGPDKCGSNDKVHFIFKHKNPISGEYEEKHLKSPPVIKNDRLTHLYTLVVRDDNTFEMFIDLNSVSKGSLLEDMVPSVNPPKEIDDPNDTKPADWVDEAEIPDPEATKPVDWDEDAPRTIPDMDASKPADWLDNELAMIDDPSVAKPEDWDDEDDGDWVPPQIPNPNCEKVSGCGEWKRPSKANPDYKGKWQAPMISNPAYKGEWAPKQIPNPSYFEDAHPARMDPIGALAIEVWTMSQGIVFDNFWLGNDLTKSQEFANLTWSSKFQYELAEEQKEKEKEEKEMQERKAKEGGFMNQLENLYTDAAEFVKKNPAVGFGSIALVSLAVVFGTVFLCAAGKRKNAKKESDELKVEEEQAEPSTEKDLASKGEEVVGSEEESETSTLRQRKKAPMVN